MLVPYMGRVRTPHWAALPQGVPGLHDVILRGQRSFGDPRPPAVHRTVRRCGRAESGQIRTLLPSSAASD